MKYKADYSKKMTFAMVLSSFNTDSKYVLLNPCESIDRERQITSLDGIYSFRINGIILINGMEMNMVNYQSIVEKDWYPVYEVKEKPPIDTSRNINKGTTTDIKKEMVIDGLNVTEHIKEICKEEIAKSERQINAKKSVIAALNTASYVINHCHNINNNMNKKQKKTKQEFDNDNRIHINMEGDMLFKWNDRTKSIPHKYATQSEINQFFKGSKNRIKISEKYDQPSNRRFYFKNGVKYYHDLRSGSYYTYGKDNYIKYITEKEYLEGLK